MSWQAEDLLGLLSTAGGHMLVEGLAVSRQILAPSPGFLSERLSTETEAEGL